MTAFEVFINRHRVCLAGVGDNGVLSAIVGSVGGTPDRDDIYLHVGGLDSFSREHLRWDVPTIGVGAEILVRVVEAAAVDPANEQYSCEPPSTLEECRRTIQDFLEQLGEDERRQLLRDLVAQLSE